VFGNSQGGVLFDPTVPITDAEASLNLASPAYGRTFGLWGRQGLVTVAVPWAWGHVEGFVGEETEAQRVTRSGLADTRVKVSLNLLGSPALDRAAFAAAPRRTILGLSLTVQAPTGEYDNTKLINLGTNRWSIKPEVGVSVPVGRWFLDAYAGAWFFTDNDEFYPGAVTRSRDPIDAQARRFTFRWRLDRLRRHLVRRRFVERRRPAQRTAEQLPVRRDAGDPNHGVAIDQDRGEHRRLDPGGFGLRLGCGRLANAVVRPGAQTAALNLDRPCQRSRTNVTSNV
jgi:hypothetical protein